LTLLAIKFLFFVIDNSTIPIAKISLGLGVGNHFVLYEFGESDKSYKWKLRCLLEKLCAQGT
jgi:hypothetical protein